MTRPHRSLHLAFLVLCCATSLSAADSRPNFILFIADDMAWNDCGAYGHPTIQTPHLDQLAKDGMRFDNAFLTCSSCSPSRCSLITGRYPHNTGAHQLHRPLPESQLTFVELLMTGGYHTAAAGKWHLGNPAKRAFNKVYPAGDASGCANWVRSLKERPKNKPFFLWLAAVDPHRGYQPNIIEKPHTDNDAVVPPFLPNVPATRGDLAMYYDEITRLDSHLGKTLAELEAQGEADNTLVLFISDNGRPFPRCKTTILDSGIKTPWIVRWPARVKPGSVCSQLVSSIDIAPAFLELAGLSRAYSFQGVDFSPLLSKPNRPVREYVHAEHNWHDFDDHQRGARSLSHKYIRTRYTDIPLTPPADAVSGPTYQKMIRMNDAGLLVGPKQICFQAPRPAEELYDLANDPFEMRNLLLNPRSTDLVVLQKMRRELDRWTLETGDDPPAERRPDEFHRVTGKRLKPR